MQHYRQGDNRKEARLKKIASEINWDEVTGTDWRGLHFDFSQNDDGSVHVVCGQYIDADYDAEEILEYVDIYDQQGNIISRYKDYGE